MFCSHLGVDQDMWNATFPPSAPGRAIRCSILLVLSIDKIQHPKKYRKYRHYFRLVLREILACFFYIPRVPKNHISNISRISGNSRKHVPKIIQGSTTQPLEPPARLRPPAARISRLWRMLQTSISNISRIWENEENPFSSISRIWEIRKIRFPVFPGYEKIEKK